MFKYVVLLAVLGLVAADLAKFQNCGESPDDVCVINEVRVTPCKNGKMCKLKKGTQSSMAFDFTPSFAASKLKAGLFWASETVDVVFPEFYNADGCQFTTCPMEAAKLHTFNYSLRLGKKLPSGTFLFKLKVWDEQDETKNCCFKTTVKLT